MKKLICLALVLAAAVVVGFCSPHYDISYVPVKIASGDTLWQVADAYYLDSKAPMCFEAYLHELRHTEANEKLFKDGRVLQPGDVVQVPMFKKK